MRGLKLALLSIMFVGLFASGAFAFSITIDPGSYTGRYIVSGNGQFTGKTILNLPSGTYYIDNGSSIGGSSFNFNVDTSGNVTNISPSAAATPGGSSLLFNNVTINVQPLSYTGRYILASYYPMPYSG